ncbi:MFS transporter, partial [bacterium]|nr:MFS transporter [bacterium]
MILDKQKDYPPARLAWTMWGLGAALYLIGFYQRVAPAVITDELMKDFAIGAAGLGNLSAFYFYSYVAMQTPTGILADRLGPRRLLTIGALVAGIGGLIFAVAPTIVWASLGRLLIGGSVAVAFVGMLKLASNWFAPRQFALATGMALFCGIIGAVCAGVPLRLLVNSVGWRPVMTASAIITMVVAAAIWCLVRDDPEEKGYRSYSPSLAQKNEGTSILAGIRELFHYRNTWLLCLIPGGVVGCILTFSGLWGVPFLTTHYGLLPAQAAALNSAMLVAWAVGGPLCGGLSDRIGLRKPIYVVCNIALVGAWSGIIFIPGLPLPILIGLLLFAGLASGGMILSFAFIKESVPSNLGGTVSGIINMGVMTGPMVMQPAVGWILDLKWQGEILNGIKIYSFDAYQTGFSLMLAWAILSAVL